MCSPWTRTITASCSGKSKSAAAASPAASTGAWRPARAASTRPLRTPSSRARSRANPSRACSPWTPPPARLSGTHPPPDVCTTADRPACDPGFSAPPTAIPGVVFAGAFDGHLRAYAASDGRLLWDFDTNRPFQTVSGEEGRGGSIGIRRPSGGRRPCPSQLRLPVRRPHARQFAAGLCALSIGVARLDIEIGGLGGMARPPLADSLS